MRLSTIVAILEEINWSRGYGEIVGAEFCEPTDPGNKAIILTISRPYCKNTLRLARWNVRKQTVSFAGTTRRIK